MLTIQFTVTRCIRVTSSYRKERLKFLRARPDIANHVQKLILRPSYFTPASPSASDTEAYIASAMDLLAPSLGCLRTFIWDGLEMPQDRIWATLRARYVLPNSPNDGTVTIIPQLPPT